MKKGADERKYEGRKYEEGRMKKGADERKYEEEKRKYEEGSMKWKAHV